MPDEQERNQNAAMGQQQPDTDPPGKLGKVPTTPGGGGGVAETGEPGPGPAARPSGGAKDPNVSHDIPPPPANSDRRRTDGHHSEKRSRRSELMLETRERRGYTVTLS